MTSATPFATSGCVATVLLQKFKVLGLGCIIGENHWQQRKGSNIEVIRLLLSGAPPAPQPSTKGPCFFMLRLRCVENCPHSLFCFNERHLTGEVRKRLVALRVSRQSPLIKAAALPLGAVALGLASCLGFARSRSATIPWIVICPGLTCLAKSVEGPMWHASENYPLAGCTLQATC